MIIKNEQLLLFNPDVLKVEYVTGLEHFYYIMAYKNGRKFYIKGYETEEEAREGLNSLNEVLRKKETVVEI